jgi:serine/threonine protein kinase
LEPENKKLYLICEGEKKYVIKFVKKDKKIKSSSTREYTGLFMEHFESPYLVEYLNVFEKDLNLCVIMNYFEKGDLWKEILTRRKNNECFTEKVIVITIIFFISNRK